MHSAATSLCTPAMLQAAATRPTTAQRRSLPLQTANPLRHLAASRVPAPRAPKRLTTVAFAFPPLIPLAVRGVLSFVVLYSSMQWVHYRGMRKDMEKVMKEHDVKQQSRKDMIRKLTKGGAEDESKDKKGADKQ